MSKKTEIITFRTNAETKEKLMQMATEKEWSIAQVVDKICREYFKEKEEASQ